ncbi:MAG: 1-acyl-sn-glycerol-3-phosphate acyltransferase, partial [Coprothermobacterota bacterium]|nr:1-acyl-sn-glycerol-3-phosphate acyltransferase [Coprothermobacterota bacterium]
MASPHRDPLVPFDYSRPHQWTTFCRLIRPLFRLFSACYFSRRLVRGLENIPLQGPVILAINHPAVADTPFVGTCLSGCRSPYFMAEEELFLDRFPFRLIASLITPL